MSESELTLRGAYETMQAARRAVAHKRDVVSHIDDELEIRSKDSSGRLIEIARKKNDELLGLKTAAQTAVDVFEHKLHSRPGNYPVNATLLRETDPELRSSNPGIFVFSFEIPDEQGEGVPVEIVGSGFQIKRTETDTPLIEIPPDKASIVTLYLPFGQTELPVEVREFSYPRLTHERKIIPLPPLGAVFSN